MSSTFSFLNRLTWGLANISDKTPIKEYFYSKITISPPLRILVYILWSEFVMFRNALRIKGIFAQKVNVCPFERRYVF